MKTISIRITRRLLAIVAVAILAMGCNVCLAKNANKKKNENAKVKTELRAGNKYVINQDHTPITRDYRGIVKYHKARVFGDTGKLLNLQNRYVMSFLNKGQVVIMEDPGAIYSLIRTESGFPGWVETEFLTFLSN